MLKSIVYSVVSMLVMVYVSYMRVSTGEGVSILLIVAGLVACFLFVINFSEILFKTRRL